MPNQVHRTPMIRNHHQTPDRSRTPARTVSRSGSEDVASLVMTTSLAWLPTGASFASRPLGASAAGGCGVGVGVGAGQGGIQDRVLGFLHGGDAELDRVGSLVLEVVRLPLGALDVALSLALLDVGARGVHVLLPAALDVVPPVDVVLGSGGGP